MINAKHVSLSFGDQIIFDNISFNVNKDQRIGLVGRNGSGKTTLFKVLCGQTDIDSGEIVQQKDCRIAYMQQQMVLLSNRSIIDEATDCDYEHTLVEAKKILSGLGFKSEQFEDSVETLSVGWKMCLILAKLLLQKADFYLFDEPTNHLDLVAKDWFLDFLKQASFGFMLVCHDRYFLDKLCDYIYEVSMGNLNVYRGNYTKYLELKEQHTKLLEKKHAEQQKFIKKQRAVIEKFRAKATKAKMAQSMLKSLGKLERVRLEQKQKGVRFHFAETKRSGKIVLNVKDVAFSFAAKPIFSHVNFQVERGQKVAIVAPNGMGKTTLLSIIYGKYKPNHGEFSFGYNVESAVFEQDQNRSLDLNKTILEEVESACITSEQRANVRSILGAFLFEGDDVYKKIRVLSGGEKNRVAMVKVLLQHANFLILDEPTNHLDLESKEVLLDVLKQFNGTILFVSHDRTFLNELATHILHVTPNGIFKYEGNYDSFLAQKSEHESVAGVTNEKKTEEKKRDAKQTNKEQYQQRKEIKKIENKIEKLEKGIELLSEKLGMVAYGTDEFFDLSSKLKTAEEKLEACVKQWEKLNG
jgi:ATP-binding cassette subfamily F protein 3